MHTHQNGQKIQLLLFQQLYALRQHCNECKYCTSVAGLSDNISRELLQQL